MVGKKFPHVGGNWAQAPRAPLDPLECLVYYGYLLLNGRHFQNKYRSQFPHFESIFCDIEDWISPTLSQNILTYVLNVLVKEKNGSTYYESRYGVSIGLSDKNIVPK